MRIHLAIVLALTLLLVPSCTWIRRQFGCAVEKKLVTTVAPAIGTALQCKNQKGIEEDLIRISQKLKVCSTPLETGNLTPVCALIGSALIDLTTDTLVPRNWECSATAVKSLLHSVVVQACQSIP